MTEAPPRRTIEPEAPEPSDESFSDPAPRIAVASYNIHRCFGTDGAYRPERIAEVIRSLDVQLVGLQEVDTRIPTRGERHQLDLLARRTGLRAIEGPIIREPTGSYGNAVLTSFPVVRTRRIDLGVGRFEPREALEVELLVHRLPLSFVVTHLGLRFWERRQQIRRLLSALPSAPWRVTVGDFNEWWGWSSALRTLGRGLGAPTSHRTYPSRRPVFSLDRVFVTPQQGLLSTSVPVTPLTRVASDHLPVVAQVELSRGEASAQGLATYDSIALDR